MSQTIKKISHKIRVWMMLHKKISKFGNNIQSTQGEIKNNSTYKKSSLQKHTISVIVLNHNNKKIIDRCLDSLIKHNSYHYQIIVVDNLSTDDSVSYLKNKYQNKIDLILNKVNGCSSGRNLGAKKAIGEYLLFLDSDQGPTSNRWLDIFIQILNNYPKIGAVSWAGGFFTENDITGPTMDCFPDQGLPAKYLFRTNIDYLGSGGLLISKDTFNKINGFDTKYDPYCFEDADLSRKIIDIGKDIAYSKDLSIYHLAHSTTGSSDNNQKYLDQFRKNALFFKNKWKI